ncbi:hypothetical protein CRG98_001326 [Punica granatum]|uniref:Pre-mRNA polyadenylation factor Fip1 domain-containing protein n=1 Tax=Punica granatum TaxID=22663 RepID=A0A2I0LC52_PUNGR|nr:hypothetical protein CRG98_001326 [Punica granatum]
MDVIEDDDFGELYADVELQVSSAIGAATALEQTPPTSAAGPPASGAKSSVSSPGESPRSNDDDDDCESEDDLNIVLNDEDCKVVPRNGAGGGSADGENGADGDDYDAFKRPSGLAFPSSLNTTGSDGVPLEDNGDDYNKNISQTSRFRAPVRSFGPQNGYNFTLPRHRSIFHVNIDAFKVKPWRYPGADITDYFNFGLDEESWKAYCNSVEQLRHRTSFGTRIPVVEALNPIKVCERGIYHEKYVQVETADGVAQTLEQCIISHSKELADREANELMEEKGQPIEVQNSVGERQPSIVLRHARTFDSDVVIEIPLQIFPEEPSCSGQNDVEWQQGNTLETSGQMGVHIDKNEVSADFLEDKTKRSKDLCSPVRCTGHINVVKVDSIDHDMEKLSDVACHSHINIQTSEGNVETLKSVTINGGVYGSPCVENPCLVENEASMVERTRLTLSSSLFESDSEVSKDGLSDDVGSDHIHLIRSPLCDKSDYSVESHRKPARVRNYPREKAMNQEEDYRDRRHTYSSKWKTYGVSDGVASPTSDYGTLSDSDYRQIDCKRWSERQHFIDRYNEELSSYYSTKRESGVEMLTDKRVRNVYEGFSYSKCDAILRDEMYPRFRRHLNEREINGGTRYSMDRKDQERGYTRTCRKYADDRDSLSSRDRKVLHYLPHASIRTHSPSGIDSEEIRLKSRNNKHDHFLGHEYDNDIMQDKYGTHYRDRDQGSLDRSYRRGLSASTEVNYFRKREGYRGGSPLVGDGSWDMDFEDEYQGFVDWGSFSSERGRDPQIVEMRRDLKSSIDDSYDSQSIRRYGRKKRQCFGDERSDPGLFGFGPRYAAFPTSRGYCGRTRSNVKSKFQHLTEDESSSRNQHDELELEEASSFNSRISRHATDQLKNFMNGGIFDNGMAAKQGLDKMMREESDACHVNRGFIDKVMSEKTVSCSKGSVDLYVSEEKAFAE